MLTFRSLGFAAVAAVALAACGPAEDDERALIPDSDVAALQQETVPPETPAAASTSGRSFYLRLAWGLLAGDKSAPNWVDWTGSLSASEGTVQLTHLTYFDREDRPDAQTEADRISWVSKTKPHFDGIVARVELPSDDATVTFETPAFSRTFRASELAGGDDAVFPVDSAGHVVSVSSIPASSCTGGFVLGYLRPATRASWVAFAGRTTDRTGKFTGTVRFRELEDGTLQGKTMDLDGKITGSVRGTVVRSADGGSFSAELLDAQGRNQGSLTGLFENASYSQRGAFQGSFEQPCAD
ncbi:MAG: hypothetical protein JST54_26890 [Deltaproteobacteria bacterium]|nr:hypothetical protein [Deltaproteobacteria bacterium]